ncbi:TPA: hypothetical protein ACH3X1_004876 [Trebouxia sp. C0004]
MKFDDLQAEVAARNHRSETGTRVAEQVKDLWHGSNCPFDIMGIFVPHIAKDYLEDSFFRTGGFEDYFGCEDFRRILWSGYPDLEGSSSEYTGLGEPYDHIKHITAQALAFMEIKVVSLLNNQKSLPKGGRASDKLVGDYEAIVSKLKIMNSQYIEVKRPPQVTETPMAHRSSTSQHLGSLYVK